MSIIALEPGSYTDLASTRHVAVGDLDTVGTVTALPVFVDADGFPFSVRQGGA